MTIQAPDVADDGKHLIILTDEAVAHTLTNTTPGFNGGSTLSDVATYSAIGDTLEIVAINGVWQIVGNEGVVVA